MPKGKSIGTVINPPFTGQNEHVEIARQLSMQFRKEITIPLIMAGGLNKSEIMKNTIPFSLNLELGCPLHNAPEPTYKHVQEALKSGKLRFHRGQFFGKLNSNITRELRRMGAIYDRKLKIYRIHRDELPELVMAEAASAQATFIGKATRINDKIDSLLLKTFNFGGIGGIMDQKLFRLDDKISKSFEKKKAITIKAQFSPKQRKLFTERYTESLELGVKDFASDSLLKLRQDIESYVLGGGRTGGLKAILAEQMGFSDKRINFIARQETRLVMAKYKEVRYRELGSEEYIWTNVVGSPNHPVRPDHEELNGNTYRWDTPPVTNKKTQAKNNPGEDYGCRCVARPKL